MKQLIAFVLICLTAAACQPDPVSKMQNELKALDQALGGAAVTDPAKAKAFIEISEALAAKVEKTQPDLYVDVLLKAAGLAKTIGEPQKALELYSRIAEGSPQHKKAPTALFMKGFVLENDLGDLEKARATYEAFLQLYPNDPDFADDAQNAIKLLGKSPDEIIKSFEEAPQDK